MLEEKIAQTPLMQQYWQFKRQHPDKLVFFRMGDFFELFFEDAQVAAKELGLTLTYRNRKAGDLTPMCGIPHQTVGTYVSRLLKAGYKVVVVDQLEPSSNAKGLVKRGVTQILTPSLVWDPEEVAQDRPCHLAAYGQQQWAFWDSTTQTGFYVDGWGFERFEWILQMLPVAEWLLPKSLAQNPIPLNPVTFYDDSNGCPSAVEAIKAYVTENWPQVDSSSLRFEARNPQTWLNTNPDFYFHLEVFETYRGDESGSLFHAINRAKSPMGQRLLRRYLSWPTRDLSEIQARHEKIQFFINQPEKRVVFQKALSQVGDLERRWARIWGQKVNPIWLSNLAKTLEQALQAARMLPVGDADWQSLQNWLDQVNRSLVDDPTQITDDVGFIREGVDPQRDQAWFWVNHGQDQIRQFEAQLRAQLEIPSLKIRYNEVFGYYIEVTHTHRHKVPKDFIRKQTLTQAERFTCPQLLELETQIQQARQNCYLREQQILKDLTQHIRDLGPSVQRLSQILAEMDVAALGAQLVTEEGFSLPQFDLNSCEIQIRQGRHPVVEKTQKNFVPNDAQLTQGRVKLIFGPNMAGKSTYLRMVALNALLAFCGLPVCAAFSRWPLLDGLFSRIGASDRLSRGESTFMLEMRETADILHQMQAHSLIILDEVGRGTATFDGLSLAQALVEYFRQKSQGYILFATHYHELAAMSESDPGVENAHMAVWVDQQGQVHFRYRLEPGHMPHSFGIWVAKQAKIPSAVWQRAEQLLTQWENQWHQLQSHLNQVATRHLPVTVIANDANDLVIPQKKPEMTNQTPSLRHQVTQVPVSSELPLDNQSGYPDGFNHLWEASVGRMIISYLRWVDESLSPQETWRFLQSLKALVTHPMNPTSHTSSKVNGRFSQQQLSFWEGNPARLAPTDMGNGNP